MEEVYTDLVQMARLSLSGRRQDVQRFVQRLAKKFSIEQPATAEKLLALARENPTIASPIRDAGTPVPVDIDTRLQLVRHEHPVVFDSEPAWPSEVQGRLQQLVEERRAEASLHSHGLLPTRSAIFFGPPGVGKTMAARWVARELQRPLMTLDLSAVMSSFLGRTGSNLRHVLDYAKSSECVLLLDEIDCVAKRRDDADEVGELKRLVTVLLQEIDDWPASGLLIAATNHPELLDRAIWRRFDLVCEFPFPDREAIARTIHTHLGPLDDRDVWSRVLAIAAEGQSFSDVVRDLRRARRESVTRGEPVRTRLEILLHNQVRILPAKRRRELAVQFAAAGLSQRQTNEVTGVSRDTIRRAQGRRTDNE